jgi:pSer/pThr/pTyr-binding forkhead associated (FHA) protein
MGACERAYTPAMLQFEHCHVKHLPGAQFDYRSGSCVYTDLGSTNGSWINDEEVDRSSKPVPVKLSSGDVLKVGCTLLRITIVETASS